MKYWIRIAVVLLLAGVCLGQVSHRKLLFGKRIAGEASFSYATTVTNLFFWFESSSNIALPEWTNAAPLTGITNVAGTLAGAGFSAGSIWRYYSNAAGISNIYLSTTNESGINAASLDADQKYLIAPFTFMLVCRIAATNAGDATPGWANQSVFGGASGGTNDFHMELAFDEGLYSLGVLTNETFSRRPTNVWRYNQTLLVTLCLDGENSSVRTNGVLCRSFICTNHNADWRIFKWHYNGTYWTRGHFFRALAWKHHLSDTDLTNVEAHIKTDYGIP